MRELHLVRKKVRKVPGARGSICCSAASIAALPLTDVLAYGTSEGASKAWDTRGRGQKSWESHLAYRVGEAGLIPAVARVGKRAGVVTRLDPTELRSAYSSFKDALGSGDWASAASNVVKMAEEVTKWAESPGKAAKLGLDAVGAAVVAKHLAASLLSGGVAAAHHFLLVAAPHLPLILHGVAMILGGIAAEGETDEKEIRRLLKRLR